MKPGLVLGVIAMLGGSAAADERSTTVTLGGVGIVQGNGETDPDFDVPILETVGGIRATFAWETRPLAYPDKRGYKVGTALVPELIAGVLMVEESDKAEALIGAGIRGELRISQREGGLLRINAKSAIYLAARGMVIGKDRDVIVEGVFGDYIYLGSPLRFGFEFGVTRRYTDTMERDPIGMMGQLYLGYGLR